MSWRWIGSRVSGSKLLDGYKTNSVFAIHYSRDDQIITRNSWALSAEKQPVSSVTLRQLNPIQKKGS